MEDKYPYIVGKWDRYKHNIELERERYTYNWKKHEPEDEEMVAVIPVSKLEELIKLAQQNGNTKD